MVGIAVDTSSRWPTRNAKRRDKHFGSVSRVKWESEASEKLLPAPAFAHIGGEDVVTWNDLLVGGDRILQEIHVTPEFKGEIVVSALMSSSPHHSLPWAPKRPIAPCQIAEATFSGSAPQQGVSRTPEAFRVPPSTLAPLGVENVGSRCGLDVEQERFRQKILGIRELPCGIMDLEDTPPSPHHSLKWVPKGTTAPWHTSENVGSLGGLDLEVDGMFQKNPSIPKLRGETASVADTPSSPQHSLKWVPKGPTVALRTAEVPFSGSTQQQYFSCTSGAFWTTLGKEKHAGSVSGWEERKRKELKPPSTVSWLGGEHVVPRTDFDLGGESIITELPREIVAQGSPQHSASAEPQVWEGILQQDVSAPLEAVSTLSGTEKNYAGSVTGWEECKSKTPISTIAWLGGEDVVTQSDLDVGEETTLEKIQGGTSVESSDEQCELSNVARIFRRPTRRAKKKKKHGAAVSEGEESRHSLKWAPKWPTTSWYTADAPVSGSTPQDVSGTPGAVWSPLGKKTKDIGSVSRRGKYNGKGLQSASTVAWLSGDDVICSDPDVGEESTLEKISGGDSLEFHDEQSEETHHAQVYRRPTRRAKKKKKYVDPWSEWVRCKGKKLGPVSTAARASVEDVDTSRPHLRQRSRPAKAAMQDCAAFEDQTVQNAQNPQEAHDSQDFGAECWVMIQTHGGGKQWRQIQGLDGVVSDVVTRTDLDKVEVEYDLSIEAGQKGLDAVKESTLQKVPEKASTEYDDDEEKEVMYCGRPQACRPVRRAKKKKKHEKIANAMSRWVECQSNKGDEDEQVAPPGDENEVVESDVDVNEETILQTLQGVPEPLTEGVSCSGKTLKQDASGTDGVVSTPQHEPSHPSSNQPVFYPAGAIWMPILVMPVQPLPQCAVATHPSAPLEDSPHSEISSASETFDLDAWLKSFAEGVYED